MAKGIYYGVNGLPRKIKKIFYGVDGVPRKIKKVFYGVGGVPRLVWSGGVQKVPNVPQLPSAKDSGARGISGKKYALFGGAGPDVYALNYSLMLSTLEPITTDGKYTHYMCAEKIGNFHLFAGGGQLGGSAVARSVYYDETSLVQGKATSLATRRWLAITATNGAYAVFAGGEIVANNTTSLRSTEAYNDTLVRTTAPDLILPRKNSYGCRIGNYALIPGGEYRSNGSDVHQHNSCEVYDQTLTRSNASNLSVARGIAAASTNEYAFLVGSNSIGTEKAVDVMDTNLVATALPDLPVAQRYPAGVGVDDYAIFDADHGTGVVYQFDNNLVRTELENATEGLIGRVGASVGNFVIFAGGSTNPIGRSVDAYEF